MVRVNRLGVERQLLRRVEWFSVRPAAGYTNFCFNSLNISDSRLLAAAEAEFHRSR
jgi:hypothetical protein